MSDKINHPDHYTRGSIEVYDFIEAWGLDFTIGNVVKYVTRAPYKGATLEDLQKAKWYLEKAIEREERSIASQVADALSTKNQNYYQTTPDPRMVIERMLREQHQAEIEKYNLERMYEEMKNSAVSLLDDKPNPIQN